MQPALLAEFARHLSQERGLAGNTCLAYAGDLSGYLGWLGSRDPLKARRTWLEDYLWSLSEGGLKGASIFRKLEAIRAFYRFQLAEERIEKDPSHGIRSPHLPQRLPTFLTLGEMDALLGVSDGDALSSARAKTAVELLYATGMRASELIALRAEYVNLEEGWVRVLGKGSKERMIPIHKRARLELSRYLRLREKHFEGKPCASEIFVNRAGKRLSRVQLWRDLRALGRRAGLSRELHPHLIRHTFATHLLQGGADARSLQELLGHANLSTTQIYTHLDPAGLKEAHRKYHPRS